MSEPASSNLSSQAGRVLQILHLEDNDFDRELIRHALRNDGLNCNITYATSEAEFEAALGRGTYDVILSDFTLPGYSGLRALSVVQKRCPEVPYVFVSGTIGEERAIDSVKNGATDYVLKDHLDRLMPALRRALREASDRTQRQLAEKALRESEERFREMAETIPDVFWVASSDAQKIAYVSPAFDQIWGATVDPLASASEQWLKSVLPEDRPRVIAAREQLSHGKKYRVEYRILGPDGKHRWIDDQGFPVLGPNGEVKRALGIAADITEKKELQVQLIQAQKMEAIGQLAGGIAHDFNNLLSVINGYTQLLLDAGLVPQEAAHQLDQIHLAGKRAASLTRQLLVFSRRQPIALRAVDLNTVLGETAEMLRRLIGEHIHLVWQQSPHLPSVRADAGMMEQVIMNLAVNARDAMPKGGTLTIATAAVTITADDRVNRLEARPGEFIRLSVQDTGCGISPENLGHIFEPFFTTKPPDRGTGLGLATVFGIVRQHEGWIEVKTVVDQGTGFEIYLPALPRSSAVSRPAAAPEPMTRGSETILLVEDDVTVRKFAATALRRLGYQVLQAETGAHAIEVWEQNRTAIALLLTDMVMPRGMSGGELAATLQAKNPNLKCVLTSGYGGPEAAVSLAKVKRARFLQKPYELRTLATTIRESLDDAPNAPAAEGENNI